MNLVEIVEFLKKFAEKIPNFGARGLVQVKINGMDDPLLIEDVSENSTLKYRISGGNATFDWNPRASKDYRWKTTNVFRGLPAAGALKVYGVIHPVVITIDKDFGDYSERWPNGRGN